MKLIEESIELEKKESANQGGYSDGISDSEEYGYSDEVDVEPVHETPKGDPGKKVITKEEVKKDPTRTSIPEKGLDWKPQKKTFKAKKRKRKTANSAPVAPAPPRERKAGPRDLGIDKEFKPYKPKRAKTAPITDRRDPVRQRKDGPREIGITKGWRRAKYDVEDSRDGISVSAVSVRGKLGAHGAINPRSTTGKNLSP